MADVREELIVVAKMLDKISPELKKISGNMKKAEKDGKRSFDKLKKSATIFGGAVAKVTGIVAAFGTAAGAASLAFSKNMSTAAASAEELGNKFNVLFGDSADDVRAWAETYRTEVNRGRQFTLQALADMRGFTEGLGLTSDEASDLALTLVELGNDLSSFYDVESEDAMMRLRSGLIGNAEALDAFAARISEGQLKEYAASLGLVVGKMSDTEKVMLRLRLLQEKTNKAQGDAAKTSDSFQNSMRGLQQTVTDVSAEFGILVNEHIKAAIEQIGGPDALNDLIRVAAALASELSQAFLDLGSKYLKRFTDAIEDMGGVEVAILNIVTLWDKVALGIAKATLVWTKFTTGKDLLTGSISVVQAVQEVAMAEREVEKLEKSIAQYQADIAIALAESGEITADFNRTLREETEGAAAALDEQAQAAAWATMDVQGLADALEQVAMAQSKVADGDGVTGDTVPSGGAATTGGTTPSGGLSDTTGTQQTGGSSLLAASGGGMFGGMMVAQVEGIKAATAAMAEYRKQAVQAQKEQLAFAAADSFADNLLAVASGAKSAGDALKSFVADIGSMIAKQAIMSALGFGGPGGFFGFANGGIVPGGGFSGGGAMPVHGYASGGPIFRKPHMAVIGEGSMDEAAVPLPDGRHIPVKMMGGSGSGETNNVNLTVQANDAASVQQLFMREGQAIADAVITQYQRNRVFRSVLRGEV